MVLKKISHKIVLLSFAILLGTFFISGFQVVRGFLQLVDEIQGETKVSFQSMTEDQRESLESNRHRLQKLFRTNFEKSSQLSIAKDRRNLVQAVLDNSSSGVEDILRTTFTLDTSLLHCSFYVREEEEVSIWESLTREDSGKDHYKNLGLEKLSKINELTFNENADPSSGEKYIEVLSPILTDEVIESDFDGEDIQAYIRYIFSLKDLEQALAEEQKAANSLIDSLNEHSKKVLLRMQQVSQSALQENILIFVIFFAVILVVAVLSSVYISNKITKPIESLVLSSEKMADGDYKTPISVESNDETGRLGVAFEKTREKIELYTDKLSEIIEEKTEQIGVMLNNIQQGIFMIDENLVIQEDFSKWLPEIFELNRDAISGKEIKDILLDQTNLSGDEKDRLIQTIFGSFGQDELAFEGNIHHFPNEVEFTPAEASDKVKFIQLDWVPIYNKKDQIIKILVSVRDETEKRKMMQQAKKSEKENNQLLQLINIDFDDFNKQMTVYFDGINAELQKKSLDLNKVFVLYHTAKGLCRFKNVTYLTEQIHLAEEKVKFLQKSSEKASPRSLITDLHACIISFTEYQKIYNEKLKSLSSASKAISVDKDFGAQAAQLYNLLKRYKKAADIGIPKEISDELFYRGHVSFESLIRELEKDIEEVAYSLEKKINLQMEGLDKFYIPFDADNGWLKDTFIHLLRNSISHGIEEKEEREKSGKSVTGVISIALNKINKDSIEISAYDDGRGIALKKIKEKSGTKESDPLKIAEQIFEHGFSTNDGADTLSGQGVGMDAIKRNLEDMECSIEISFKASPEVHKEYCPFAFIITIPKKIFVLGEDIQLVA